jgi:hypothetical protein
MKQLSAQASQLSEKGRFLLNELLEVDANIVEQHPEEDSTVELGKEDTFAGNDENNQALISTDNNQDSHDEAPLQTLPNEENPAEVARFVADFQAPVAEAPVEYRAVATETLEVPEVALQVPEMTPVVKFSVVAPVSTPPEVSTAPTRLATVEDIQFPATGEVNAAEDLMAKTSDACLGMANTPSVNTLSPIKVTKHNNMQVVISPANEPHCIDSTTNDETLLNKAPLPKPQMKRNRKRTQKKKKAKNKK